MQTIQEYTISDHKPKKILVRIQKRKKIYKQRKKREIIQHEKLKNPETEREYRKQSRRRNRKMDR